MSFRSALLAVAAVPGFLIVGTAVAGADGPKFTEYAVPHADVYRGRIAKPILDSAEKREFRSKLMDQAVGKADFAGHYKFVRWGVGTGCQTGAVVDAKSGAVTFLPSPSCMADETSELFYYKVSSRLLVYGGHVGEDGPPGPNYFVFDGVEFTPLATAPATSKGSDQVQNQSTADPVATIANVVVLIDGGKMPSWADEQFFVAAKPYVSSELLAAIHDGGERAQKAQENIWDGDIFTGAQGLVHAKLFGATVVSNDGNKAVVTAEIGASDDDAYPKAGAKFRYEMLREDGKWKIDNIKSLEEWAKDMKPLKETFLGAGQMAGIEPAAGNTKEESKQPWPAMWEASQHKPYDFVLLCYGSASEAILASYAKTVGPEKIEETLVVSGGNRRMAQLAYQICDSEIRKLGYFDDSTAFQDAKITFNMAAAVMDKKMLTECQSERCKRIAKYAFGF